MKQPHPIAVPFPNYLEIPTAVAMPIWYVLRVCTVLGAIAVAITLFIAPEFGLKLFWGMLVPVLPALWFIAPGIWRNVCPMAALNQMPRLLGFARGVTLSEKFKPYTYVVAISLLFIFVSGRKVLFNTNGVATGVLVLGGLSAAFIGGLIFKGKSGWCSSICPLLPVQRVYGQTPFALVPNAHCRPCLGCTKNCYDFNPTVAYLADLTDSDPSHAAYRKFFAASFPGFVAAFYLIPDASKIGLAAMYGGFALYMLVSAGLFYFLESFLKVSANKLTALYGGVVLNIYYGFTLPVFLSHVFGQFGWQPAHWLSGILLGGLASLTILWIYRTYTKETRFAKELAGNGPTEVRIGTAGLSAHQRSSAGDRPEVHFVADGRRILAKANCSILETAEASDIKIESGCRMGVCGADPICIEEGMESLSPLGREERATIERLGLSAETTRMACCARVQGPVSVSFTPQRAKAPVLKEPADPSIKSVVIIGNGIAGVTAADQVRRRHPDTKIHVIGRERHHLYNRMGIARLIYGQSAMSGLYLQPDSWYADQKIQTWLNTLVAGIDTNAHEVQLGTGEKLQYDRLILATGSQSFFPPIVGFGIAGTFGLRTAEDAMEMRSFVQEQKARNAVIAGGGLLGLEAGYALRKIGLNVTVLERSAWLLRRQLDQRSSEILREQLEDLGLKIILNSEAATVLGSDCIDGVVLKDGRQMATDVLVVCAGIAPNTQLAVQAGLEAKRGVTVDDHLRTSDPRIYAVGDVAEHKGTVYGLWPAAVEQATCAAANAVGQATHYKGTVEVVVLKVVGVELTSIGQFEEKNEGDSSIVIEDVHEKRYRKIVLASGRVVGGILLNNSDFVPSLSAAVNQSLDVSTKIDALKSGDWSALAESLEA